MAGGVSSWVQMLIEGMPEHEFVIYTIAAQTELKGQYKYRIPKNVVEIRENFLDRFLNSRIARQVKCVLDTKEQEAVRDLVTSDSVDWETLFDLFHDNNRFDANTFLASNAFLDIIMEACGDKYRLAPFGDVFWTLRSMLLPVFNILRCPVPDVDIFHSVSTGYAGLLGTMFSYFSGKPLIISEHGIYTREREEEILKAGWVDAYFKQTWIDFFGGMSRAAYERASRIIALFARAGRMQQELGADRSKCRVIPNGIDTQRFSHIGPAANDGHPLALGAIIRTVPIKDLKTMIYGFDLVRKRFPDASLYMIGPTDEDPVYYRECRELIRSLRVEGIEFVGRVDVTQWYGKLDIVILSSISEGQPFVILEAMASHRPVIATDVGSCRELVEGGGDEFGDAGIIVPVMNPSLLARAVIRLATDRTLQHRMAGEGYRRADRYYRERDFLGAYETLYKEVTDQWLESVLN